MKLTTGRLLLALGLCAVGTYASLIVYGAKPWAYVVNGAVVLAIYYYFTALAPRAGK